MYLRDVLEDLGRRKLRDVVDFEWKRNIRFYGTDNSRAPGKLCLVCLERFLGFPKLTALLVTFRLYLLACFEKNRYFLLSPGFIRNLDTADNCLHSKTTTKKKQQQQRQEQRHQLKAWVDKL